MEYKVILISHNDFAEGLRKALEMIMGNLSQLKAYGLQEGENPDLLIQKIRQEIAPSEQVIILADIFGGSMCNSALRLLDMENVTLVAGMNLPLAMEIILMKPKTKEALDDLIEHVKSGIKRVELDFSWCNDEDE